VLPQVAARLLKAALFPAGYPVPEAPLGHQGGVPLPYARDEAAAAAAAAAAEAAAAAGLEGVRPGPLPQHHLAQVRLVCGGDGGLVC